MAAPARVICASADLVEGGDGVRFECIHDGVRQAAFALRWQGVARAYLNQCRHIPVELDWNPGKFLDASGDWLICATHGALYAPDSGECVAGPCSGERLRALAVAEENGRVILIDDEGETR